MTISEVEAHSRAVASIQALLSKHSPGSSPYRIAERALDLAFNGSCANSTAFEQALLAEAESLLAKQVLAKLLAEFAEPSPKAQYLGSRDSGRVRYLAWRGSLRPHEAEQFVQAELWLTAGERCGDGYALLS